MLGLFIVALVVCLLSAGTNTVLHFQMKFRLEAAGLQVKWFMMPQDDLRILFRVLTRAYRATWIRACRFLSKSALSVQTQPHR